MTTRRTLLGYGVTIGWLGGRLGGWLEAVGGAAPRPAGAEGETAGAFEVTRSDAEWRQRLTPQQFHVLRQHGTERPGSSPLDKEYGKGTYHCTGCDLPLFSSATKFDSRTGWPSFWAPLENAVGTSQDRTLFMVRTEVHCRRCGGHLGHVFEDGPPPTGLRYCMNGVALVFRRA
jgi:peptide-methionine (R)-S-oxide reductase